MTLLSIYRSYILKVYNRRGISTRDTVFAILATICIITLATFIAVLPLLNLFENYFVNGLHYSDVPLFVGAPDKAKHMKIFEFMCSDKGINFELDIMIGDNLIFTIYYMMIIYGMIYCIEGMHSVILEIMKFHLKFAL